MDYGFVFEDSPTEAEGYLSVDYLLPPPRRQELVRKLAAAEMHVVDIPVKQSTIRDIVATARIAIADVDASVAYKKLADTAKERDCWKLASLALQRALDDFETTIAFDENLLANQAQNELDTRLHMAVVLRLGEKRALQSALDRVKKRLKEMWNKSEL